MSNGMETYLDTNRNTYKKSYTNTDTCLMHVVWKIDRYNSDLRSHLLNYLERKSAVTVKDKYGLAITQTKTIWRQNWNYDFNNAK